MKRIVSVLLVMCLLMGLCACGAPIETQKFGSEQELQNYLQGVWKSTTLDGNDEHNYIIFKEDAVYIYAYSDSYLTTFKDSFAERIETDGYKAFSELSVADYVREIEENQLSTENGYVCAFKHKSGFAVFKDEYKIYAGNGIIHYAGQDYERLSNVPTYEAAGFTQQFVNAHKDYAPPFSLYKLTNEEYAKALMELHPEIKNYPLVDTEDGFTMYSDTGKKGDNNYDSALMWTDSTLVFTKRVNSTDKYLVNLSDSSLMVQDKHHRESWETLAADALALFGDAPGVPTPQELVTQFRENGKTETFQGLVNTTTTFKYKTEIGGVTVEMSEAFETNNNSKLLILRFE